MKKEQLERFLEMTDDQKIVELLINLNDEQIEIVYNLLKVIRKNEKLDNEQIELIKRYLHEDNLSDILEIVAKYSPIEPYAALNKNKLINKYLESGSDTVLLRIINNSDILNNRTYDEILKLIDKYMELVNSIDSHILFDMTTNPTVLAKRTCEEQLKLIDQYAKLVKIDGIYDIIVTEEILYRRTFEEQMKLIEMYINSDQSLQSLFLINDDALVAYRTQEQQSKLFNKYNEVKNNECDKVSKFVHSIIIKENVLSKRTYEQQMELIEKYLEINTKEIGDILVNYDILSHRTHEEHMKLVDAYLKSDMDNNVKQIICNPNILSSIQCVEQLKLIDKFIKLNKSLEFLELACSAPQVALERYCSSTAIFEIDEKGSCKKVTECLDELTNLKEVINLLKRNNIEDFNGNAKVYIICDNSKNFK